jgi:hypothetical protein
VTITSDVLAAHLGDEAVLLDLSAKRYYRLNESAAVAFRALEEGEGRDGAIRRLVATFEVGESDAASPARRSRRARTRRAVGALTVAPRYRSALALCAGASRSTSTSPRA